nr:hypothetical protein [Marinicella sp. W31]MDC2877037.1 hypothetical protein [Marinicella sp. W31]
MNDQDITGLVAKLYKVKGYDPSSKTDTCPPTLVFRGTDFDDMRDFAFCVILNIAPGAGETPVIDLQDVLEKQYPGGEIMFAMDKRLKGKSRKELIADNFIPITLLNSSCAFRLLGVPYQASLQLIFLGGPNGDWANNVEQGLGKPSEQYNKAERFGGKIAKSKIKPGQDRRLNIAGHSLGGGLASATATVVEHFYHTDITTLCHTFNPSGVNTETVKPASLGEATINAFGVRDEILTTIETRAGQLPFLGAILRWAKAEANIDGFPAPAGNFVPRKGISPGPSSDPPQTRPVVLPTGGIGQQIIPTWQPPARGGTARGLADHRTDRLSRRPCQ